MSDRLLVQAEVEEGMIQGVFLSIREERENDLVSLLLPSCQADLLIPDSVLPPAPILPPL